jgi:hypothetical protein
MEMVEEYPEHLFGALKQDLFQEHVSVKKIQEGAKNAILLLDTNLPYLLDF